ncbi:hypothetical protein [Sorangium atrum]|uniref:Uncharacterized protein n=1 Tax=Sorangium atrum TaxID=2995308 RepID=A0ABT5CBW5_9BACT|nr:hypothetical protein [Sorangium aterium]MDC0682626.1 hypothetical protein [Sorangium aterium]
MKTWDLLLEWMTHLGSGAWGAFREAVEELTGDQDPLDAQSRVRTLRIAFSDLSHVDFFVEGSRRWRMLRPALVGLSQNREHLFVGGRTRSIMDRLCGAGSSNVMVTTAEPIAGLTRVHVTGAREAVAGLAESLGIEYVANAAAILSTRLPPIRAMVDAGQPAQEPINWSVRSWSFQDEKWVNERLDRTVREYSNRQGVRRYLVHAGKTGMREIEKRASIYCAAYVRGARIVNYSHDEGRLRVPTWAPLPAIYARAACLAGGRPSAASEGEILFESVDPRIASMLLVGLGQGVPMPEAKR